MVKIGIIKHLEVFFFPTSVFVHCAEPESAFFATVNPCSSEHFIVVCKRLVNQLCCRFNVLSRSRECIAIRWEENRWCNSLDFGRPFVECVHKV